MKQGEKTIYNGGIVHLNVLNKEDLLLKGDIKASSVHAFAFSQNNEILFTRNHKGIDIIGGHIEKGETPEQALIRESMEEACMIPVNYELIGAIVVDNSENPKAIEKGYPITGYQLFYQIKEYTLLDFEKKYESTGIIFLRKEQVQKEHHNWLQSYNILLDFCELPTPKKSKRFKI